MARGSKGLENGGRRTKGPEDRTVRGWKGLEAVVQRIKGVGGESSRRKEGTE